MKITENRLLELINRAMSQILHEQTGLILEYEQVNTNDDDTSYLPNDRFKVIVPTNDHMPPHFHVKTKDGWHISFKISNGALYREIGRGKNPKTLKYLTKSIPLWLQAQCQSDTSMTNKAFVAQIWRKNNMEKLQKNNQRKNSKRLR